MAKQHTKTKKGMGTYNCPHCHQQMEAKLSGWNESKHIQCTNPECGKPHFIPPVTLGKTSGSMEDACLVICPECFEVTNATRFTVGQKTKCPKCSANVLVSSFDQQIKFANDFYSRQHKETAPAAEDTGKKDVQVKPAKEGDKTAFNWKRILKTQIPVEMMGQNYRLDVLLNNPFWILGIPSSGDEKALNRSMQRIKGRLKLKRSIPLTVSLGGKTADEGFPSDGKEAQKRLELLKDVRQQLLYSLFWPGADSPAKLPKDYIVNLAGDEQQEQDSKGHALQARAAAALIMAVSCELDYITGNREAAPDQEWRTAINRWGELFRRNAIQAQLDEKMKQAQSLELTRRVVKDLLNNLPLFILSIAKPFIESYIRAGRMMDASRLIRVCSEADFDADAKKECLIGTIRQMSGVPLEDLISRARAPFNKKKVGYGAFAERFDAILDEAQAISVGMFENLGVDESFASELRFDSLVEVVLDKVENALDISSRDDKMARRNRLQGLLTLDRVLTLPMDETLRFRVKALMNNWTSNLYPADWGGIKEDPVECFFLPGEKASPKHSLVIPVCKIKNVTLSNYTWNTRFILIPRSDLAKDLHEGKLSRKELTRKYPNSPRIKILNQPGEFKRLKKSTFSSLYVVVESALKSLHAEFVSGSKKLEEIDPYNEEVLAIEKEIKEKEKMQRGHDDWSKKQYSKKGCGIKSLWRYYLPGVLAGGILPLFVPVQALAEKIQVEKWYGVVQSKLPFAVPSFQELADKINLQGLMEAISIDRWTDVLPLEALADLLPIESLPNGLYISQDGLMMGSVITPQIPAFMIAGLMLAMMVHFLQYRRWKGGSKRRIKKLDKQIKSLRSHIDDMKPDFMKLIDGYQARVSGIKKKIDNASKESRKKIAKAESVNSKFSDLKPLKRKGEFSIYQKTRSQGYKEGTKPNEREVTNQQVNLIRNANEAELDRCLIQAGVAAHQLIGVPAYKKREIMINAIQQG